MNEIQEKLEQYKALVANQKEVESQQENLPYLYIPRDIWETYEARRDQYQAELDGIESEIKQLGDEIKAEVAEVGETVNGEGIKAVFTKGRVSWNDSFLMGLATIHPAIMQGRTVGKASVSIRVEKEK